LPAASVVGQFARSKLIVAEVSVKELSVKATWP
jgi:hypothetical protein